MKRIIARITLLLAFCGCYSHLSAQDIIILKTGDEIPSKVEEVGLDIVKYKKFENPTGPVYTIEKTKIFMIKYENGSKDVFGEQPQEAKQDTKEAVPPVAAEPEKPKTETPKPLEYVFGNVRQNNRLVPPPQVRSIMAPYSDALELYDYGRTFKITGDVLEGLGYGLFVISYFKAKNDYNNASTRAFIGGCTSLAACFISHRIGKSNIKQSVSVYNAKIGKPESFYFQVSPSGLGLRMNF